MWKPDDVVGQDPAEDVLADAVGQHAPRVRLRPRDVDEVVQEDVGPRFAHERRERVQVVVVDHDDRVDLAVDLVDDRPREVVVDDVVAELERLDLVAADVRRVGQVPQVVLDEPQHRVGEDAVEAVVGVGVRHHESHVILAAGRRVDHERPPAGLLGLHHVALGHRRGDPHRVAVRRQAGQRGDEAAGPARDGAVVVVGDRSAMGYEHQRGMAAVVRYVHRGRVGHGVARSSPKILR